MEQYWGERSNTRGQAGLVDAFELLERLHAHPHALSYCSQPERTIATRSSPRSCSNTRSVSKTVAIAGGDRANGKQHLEVDLLAVRKVGGAAMQHLLTERHREAPAGRMLLEKVHEDFSG